MAGARLEQTEAPKQGGLTFRNGLRFSFPETSTKVHFGTLIQ